MQIKYYEGPAIQLVCTNTEVQREMSGRNIKEIQAPFYYDQQHFQSTLGSDRLVNTSMETDLKPFLN